ncbi:MAG: AAA family ATPase [Campylobacteraceae bacterium]|jgi:hypothetical protein|nr:AAA family ATPase [Campylobacteraceae bacterium]
MPKLDFIKGVTQDMLNRPPRKNLIDGFVVTRSINILWAPAGTGKTEFMFAVAQLLLECGQEIAYIDVDNAVDLLEDRGYKTILDKYKGRFTYVNADQFDMPKQGILEEMDGIRKRAVDNFYEDCVFILDSLKFFVDGDLYDEGKIQRLMGFCKSIRRCGGCVWLLNHATKKGDTMKGAQGLVDAADECWGMTVLPEDLEHWNYILTPEKVRLGQDKVYKVGFALNKKTYKLKRLDVEIAQMTQDERETIDKVTAALRDKELTQGEIVVDLLGKTKGDRNTLAMLQKHEGRFWNIEKNGKEKKYKLAS